MRFDLSDEEWAILEPLIPAARRSRRVNDRRVMNGIFFVLRTGCQWKALDATKYCPGSTAHDRFQAWVQAGVFFEFWKMGLLDYDCLKGIDWSWLSMDGCMTKAPLGGEKDRQKPDRSRQIGSQAFGAHRS